MVAASVLALEQLVYSSSIYSLKGRVGTQMDGFDPTLCGLLQTSATSDTGSGVYVFSLPTKLLQV